MPILDLIVPQTVCMLKLASNNGFEITPKYGHKPIVLLGGGTTLIGDPSGKDATRKIINKSDIKKNIIGIKQNFKTY